VVFFLGIFWRRLNGPGCLAALIVGFALGVFRLAVDTPPKIWPDYQYVEGSLFWIVNKIYFQYFSLLIFIVSSLVMIIVSLMTQAPDYQRISGLTFGTLSETDRNKTRESWSTLDVVTSLGLMVIIVAAYLYFTG
jgi:SSS family solute:Na+ symporter